MESLAEVYRDLCLLRLKYEHLCDVCSTLLKKWPKHEPSGRLVKGTEAAETARAETGLGRKTGNCKRENSQTDPAVNTATADHEVDRKTPTASNPADLLLLEKILSRAHRIRASQTAADSGSRPAQKPSKSTETAPSYKKGGKVVGMTSSKLAADVYAPASKRPSLQARSKPPSSATLKLTRMGRRPPRGGALQATGASYRQQQTRVQSGSRQSTAVTRRGGRGGKINSASSVGPAMEPSRVAFDEHNRVVQAMGESPFHVQSKVTPLQAKVEQLSLGGSEDESRGSVADMGDKKGGNSSQVVSCEMEERNKTAGFYIRDSGSRLTMPSKYHRLHGTLSKLTEYWQSVTPNPEAQEAAEHFCARLTAKGTTSTARSIQLLLAKQEYGILKEQLLSLTPQELAVSERTKWQDVLKVKTKLDLLNLRIQALQKQLTAKENVGDPRDTHPDTPAPVIPHQLLPSLSPPPPLGYVSLGDWQALALSELQVKLRSCEVEVLRFCTEVLLPKIAHVQGNDSRYLPALIQAIHNLAGLDSKPIFIAVEQ